MGGGHQIITQQVLSITFCIKAQLWETNLHLQTDKYSLKAAFFFYVHPTPHQSVTKATTTFSPKLKRLSVVITQHDILFMLDGEASFLLKTTSLFYRFSLMNLLAFRLHTSKGSLLNLRLLQKCLISVGYRLTASNAGNNDSVLRRKLGCCSTNSLWIPSFN